MARMETDAEIFFDAQTTLECLYLNTHDLKLSLTIRI